MQLWKKNINLRNIICYTISLVFALLLFACHKPSNNKNNKRKTPNPDFVHNIDIGNSVVLGNPNAKVTVTKFTDFQ